MQMNTTRFTIIYRESHMTRQEVVDSFFDTVGATTRAEEVQARSNGTVSFLIHDIYNRVIESTLNRRITDMDPLAELRINGQSYASRGLH
jgi:hypothetical protein